VGGNAALRSLYPQETASVPIVQEALLLSGMVWTGYVKTPSPQPPELEPRTVQPVAIGCTNYAIPADIKRITLHKLHSNNLM
jgi:hypothetical protein